MGPKTTPSLISRGGVSDPPPLAWDEIDTPWEIGLMGYPKKIRKGMFFSQIQPKLDQYINIELQS